MVGSTSRLAVAWAVLALAGFLLAGCEHKAQRAACPAGKICLEYGNASDPRSLDPQQITATTEAAIVGELMEGLYTDGPDGAPVLAMARSVATSPDGLIWTFKLRPALWSDGKPVTADDFVFAYRRMLNPKTATSYSYLLYTLKNGKAANDGKTGVESIGVKALDPETLELTLEHPAPYLPQLLKHQSYFPLPAHAVEKWGEAWVKPGRYVGNGPYVLVDWRLGDYVRIEKNPRFHDASSICIDRINFYPLSDAVSAERRVMSGELDVSNTIQSSRVAFLRKDPKMGPFVRTHPYLSTNYMIFNRQDVPALKDVRVRQALSMAIDRAFITDKLMRAGQIPTTAFVPAMIAGYSVPGQPNPHAYWANWSLEKRQAEARRLLGLAGYGPGHELKLQLKGFINTDTSLAIQSIQADLKAVGIDVALRQEEGVVVLKDFEIRDFQIGVVGWIADFNDPLTYLGLMKSDTGAQNYGDYKSPEYDALLDKADHEPDAVARARYLAQAEQLMLDDADVAPIMNGVNRNLVSTKVTGWVDNAVDVHRARYLCMRG